MLGRSKPPAGHDYLLLPFCYFISFNFSLFFIYLKKRKSKRNEKMSIFHFLFLLLFVESNKERKIIIISVGVYRVKVYISPKHIEIQCLTHTGQEKKKMQRGSSVSSFCAAHWRAPMNRNRHTTKQQSGVWEGETEYRCARVSHIRELPQ